MEQYAGLDVSLEATSVCIIDGAGEPEALVAWFAGRDAAMVRIGIEAGPLSQWLFPGMADAGLPVELLETRHVRAALKTMTIKTDRKDARGIAHLMRKAVPAGALQIGLGAGGARPLDRAQALAGQAHDIEMSLRGVLRGFRSGSRSTSTTPLIGAWQPAAAADRGEERPRQSTCHAREMEPRDHPPVRAA